MTRRVTRTAAALALAAASFSLAFPSQVRLVDLEQMTHRAARIFSGRCTGSRVEHDPTLQRDVVVATFHVQRAVKGSVPGGTVTVRMLAGPAPAAGSEAAGVPTFKQGEEVVLFLYGDSPLGLTSPVGLGQGRFKVFEDKRGRKVALNDFGNRNLHAHSGAPGSGKNNGKHAGQDGERSLDPAALLDEAAVFAAKERSR